MEANILKEVKKIVDGQLDLVVAVQKVSDAVTLGVNTIKKLADAVAASLPVNGGGGVSLAQAEEHVNALNTLADGMTAAVNAALAEITPPAPPAV